MVHERQFFGDNVKFKKRNNSLLIADDEVELTKILAQKMLWLVSRVHVAYNGQEALEITRKESIDVALLDMKMPKMDGISCLTAIHERSPHTVGIIVSAFSDTANIRKAMMAGAHSFIDKPINDDILTAAVLQACEMADLRKENDKILQALLLEYADIDPESFCSLTRNEKLKALRIVSGIMEVKLLRGKDKHP